VAPAGNGQTATSARGRYQAGLDRYRDRGSGDPEAPFLARKRGGPPPSVVAATDGDDELDTTDDSGN
jgi:hypothetical protein